MAHAALQALFGMGGGLSGRVGSPHRHPGLRKPSGHEQSIAQLQSTVGLSMGLGLCRSSGNETPMTKNIASCFWQKWRFDSLLFWGFWQKQEVRLFNPSSHSETCRGHGWSHTEDSAGLRKPSRPDKNSAPGRFGGWEWALDSMDFRTHRIQYPSVFQEQSHHGYPGPTVQIS